MAGALASTALAALVQLASMGADVGIRVEGRSTTLDRTDDRARTRGAYSTTPRAMVNAEAIPFRFEGTYAPQFWTSDVDRQPEPLEQHRADASLRVSTSERWSVTASAAGSQGETDPLAAFPPSPAGGQTGGAATQAVQTPSVRTEDLRTALRGEVTLTERTTGALEGAWQISRAARRDLRALLPTQRTTTADALLSRALTERDTLRLTSHGQLTDTGSGATATRTGSVAALLTWARQVSERLDVRAGAGATLAWSESLHQRPDRLPSAEAGLAWNVDRLSGDAGARLTTTADRYTGEVFPSVEGTASLRWTTGERVALSARAFGGGRTDGETLSAGAEASLSWTLRERLALEVGARGRRQRERLAGVPSYTEVAAFVALDYRTEHLVMFGGGP